MFNHIFLNSKKDIEQLSLALYHSIGIEGGMQEGDSANVLNGIYFLYSIFGVEIKLEHNSYDYDDKYQYMVSVKESFLSSFKVDRQILNNVTEIVIKLLVKNLNIEVAFEESEDNLKIFKNDNISYIEIQNL